jgi:hypothetical protein
MGMIGGLTRIAAAFPPATCYPSGTNRKSTGFPQVPYILGPGGMTTTKCSAKNGRRAKEVPTKPEDFGRNPEVWA